jgi:hypothetical protein
MTIKFAKDIIKEIQKRGSVTIPKGYVTGEAFEKWLRSKKDKNNKQIKE